MLVLFPDETTTWSRIEGLRAPADFHDETGALCPPDTLQKQFFDTPGPSGYGDVFVAASGDFFSRRRPGYIMQIATVRHTTDGWVLHVTDDRIMEAFASIVTQQALGSRPRWVWVDLYAAFRRRSRVPEAATPMALLALVTRFVDSDDMDRFVREAVRFLAPRAPLPSVMAMLVGVQWRGALLTRDRPTPVHVRDDVPTHCHAPGVCDAPFP
jgi:hypothetical protein